MQNFLIVFLTKILRHNFATEKKRKKKLLLFIFSIYESFIKAVSPCSISQNQNKHKIFESYLPQRFFAMFNFATKMKKFVNKDSTIFNFATKMKKEQAKSLNLWLSTNILRHVQFYNKDEKRIVNKDSTLYSILQQRWK